MATDTYGTQLCHYCGTQTNPVGSVEIDGASFRNGAQCPKCHAKFMAIVSGPGGRAWRLACNIFDAEGEARTQINMIRVSNGLSTLDEDLGLIGGILLKPRQ